MKRSPSLFTNVLFALSLVVVCFAVLGIVGSARAGNITWNVAGGGVWDTSTPNWTGDSTTYTDGDNVTFNNVAGGTIIVKGMSPTSTTVNNASGTYTFVSEVPTTAGGAPSILTGTLVKEGAGTLQLGASNIPGPWTYPPYANGFTSVTVNGGMIVFSDHDAFGTATVTMAGGTSLKGFGSAEGRYLLGNEDLANDFFLSGGPVNSGLVYLPLGWTESKDIWLKGAISGPGGFKITGSHRVVTLSANNTFEGGFVFECTSTSATVLQIASYTALGTGTLTVGQTLGTGTGGGVLAAENLDGTAADKNGVISPDGVTNKIFIQAGRYFNVSGSDASKGLLLSGEISGEGTLRKFRNASTVTLAGTNIYTGGTIVEVGTLKVNGSLAGGTVSVATQTDNTTAILGGTGVIAGPVSVAATSGIGRVNLITGGGVGTTGMLSLGGGLTFGAGAIGYFDIAGVSDMDYLNVTGDLIAAGGTIIRVPTGLTDDTTYSLIGYTGSASDIGNFVLQNLTGGLIPAGYTLSYGASSLDLVTAANRLWTGGGDDDKWQTGENWDGVPVIGSILHFAILAGTAVMPDNDFDAGTTFPSIVFDVGADSFILGGNSINMTGDIINNSSSDQIIDMPMVLTGANRVDTVAANVTFAQNISGPGNLTKVGAGTLIMSGANNDYAGTTNITAGTLQLDGSLTGAGGLVAVPTGGALNVGAGGSIARDVTVSGGAMSLAGTMAAGTLKLTGGSITTAAGPARVATANFSNPGTGAVDASANALAITNTLNLPGGVTATYAAGGSATAFTVGGSNIVNDNQTGADARTVTLSGGTLSFTVPAGRLMPIEATPAAWYRFDDPANFGKDSSGNNYDMTVYGSPSAAGSGKFDGAIALDNTKNQRLELAGTGWTNLQNALSPAGGATGQTAILWVKKSAAQVNLQNTSGILKGLGTGSNSHYTWDNGQSYFNDFGNNRIDGIPSPNSTTQQSWVMIALVRDPSTVRSVYFNPTSGSAVPAKTQAAGTLTWGSAFDLGLNESNLYFGGSMDDVMLFNKALSAAELAALYNDPGTYSLGTVNMPNTNIAVTASSVLDLPAGIGNKLGKLTLVGGSELTISGATGASFNGLAGTGSVAGTVIIPSGAEVSPGTDSTPISTITASGLTLDSGSLLTWDIADDSGDPGSIDQIIVTGSGGLTINGGLITLLSTTGGTFSTMGTYNLIGYAGSIGGNVSNLYVVNKVPETNYIFGTGNVGGADYVQLTISNLGYWNGGGGTDANWNNAANWNETAPITGDVLIFRKAGTGGATLNNNLISPSSFASLQFDSGAPEFVLNGNAITLTGEGPGKTIIVNNSTATQTVGMNIALEANGKIDANSGDIAVGGDISGDGYGLTKTGGNKLTLSGTNTYTGATTVTAGTLQLDASGSLTSDVTVSGANMSLAGTLKAGTTLTLTSGSIATAAGPARVATADFSAGGTVDAGTTPLTITSTMKLPQGVTATYAAGDGATAFTIQGGNIADNTADRTLTLSGGTLTIDCGSVPESLRIWLDASNIDGSKNSTLTDGGPVAAWADKTENGNNATQTEAARQPTYVATSGLNGRPALRFDGGDDRLMLGDLSAQFPTAATFFAVIKPNNDTMYSAFGNRDNDERWRGGNWDECTPGPFRTQRVGHYDAGYDIAKAPTSGTHIFAFESNSSVYRMVVDGTSLGNRLAQYNSGSGKDWIIGSNGSNNGAEFNGDIAELVFFNTALTAEQMNNVGGYLATKYGLTGTGYTGSMAPMLYTNITVTSMSTLVLPAGTRTQLGKLTLVDDAELAIDGAYAVSFNGLAGNGSVLGTVIIPSGGMVSPGGESRGRIDVSGLTLKSGSLLTFEIDSTTDLDQIFVTDRRDLVVPSGGLEIQGGAITLILTGEAASELGTYNLIPYVGGIIGDISKLSVTNEAPFGVKYTIADARIPTKNAGFVTLIVGEAGYWNGGGGADADWSNSDNWNTVPPVEGDVLLFATAGAGGAATLLNNNLAGGRSYASLVFHSAATDAFTLDGNSIKLTGDGPGKIIIKNNSTAKQTVNMDITLGADGKIDIAAGDIAVGGDITGAYSLTKTGAGTLTLSGTNSFGDLTVGGGAIDLGGSTSTVGAVSVTTAAGSGDTIGNGNLITTSYAVSNATGDVGISANLGGGSGGLTKTGAGTLTFGGSSNSIISGRVIVNAGGLTIDTGATLTVGDQVANDNYAFQVQGSSTVNVDGILNVEPGRIVGVFQQGTLVVTGTVNTEGAWIPVGSSDSAAGVARIILEGSGQWNHTTAGNCDFVIGEWGDVHAELIIRDSAKLTSAFMAMARWSDVTYGTVIQDGGTVTLAPTTAQYLSWMEPALGLGADGRAEYHLNGGVLDSGFIGVSWITATGQGRFYFNGGTLKPNTDDPNSAVAAAVGQTSYMQNLKQVVVQEGGAIIDTDGHSITIAQNLEHDPAEGAPAKDGGLTKLGEGTLTLTGVNTYTGDTTVSAGTLILADAEVAGQLKFIITGTGSTTNSNMITGTGTVQLDGDFTFDMLAAGDILGDTWTIVDVDTLASAIFGDTFTLVDFAGGEGAGVLWSKSISSSKLYEFSEATGILMVKLAIAGDTNGDGVVDAVDYIALKTNFGMTEGATLAMGNFDADIDGNVDWDDLQILMANFGTRSIGGAPAAPEPATLGLLAIGALAVLRRRRAA